MKVPKNKYFRIVLTVLLLACVPLCVFAVKNGITPTVSSGGFYSKTVNRMDFSLDKTEFTLKKNADGKETFIVTAELSVNKCEPDFFAYIKDVNINGISCNYVSFTAGENNGENVKPENIYLRDTSPLTWTVEISFDAAAKQTLTPELQIGYTAGLTKDTADEHLLSIPLTVTIQ